MHVLRGEFRVEGNSNNNDLLWDIYSIPLRGDVSFNGLRGIKSVYDYFDPEHYIVIKDSFVTNVDLVYCDNFNEKGKHKGSFLVVPKHEYLSKENFSKLLYTEQEINEAIDIEYRLIEYIDSVKGADFAKYRKKDYRFYSIYKESRKQEIDLLNYTFINRVSEQYLLGVDSLIKYLLKLNQKYEDIVKYYPMRWSEDSNDDYSMYDTELEEIEEPEEINEPDEINESEEIDNEDISVENNTDEIYEE